MDLLEDDLNLNLNSSFSDMMFPISFSAPPVPPPAMDVEDSTSGSWSPVYEPITSVEDTSSSSEKRERSSRKKKADDDDFLVDDEEDDVYSPLEEEEDHVATKPRRGNVSSKKASSTTRKRRVDDSVDSVELARDVLLTISSEDYEALVEGIVQRRALSEAEKKDVRRQKRLIKNRESAAQSRNRKKQALESLAAENQELRDKVEEQKSRFAALESILAGMGHLEAVVKQLGSPLGASRNARGKAGVGIMFIMILSFSLFNLPLLMGSSSMPVGPGGTGDNLANLRQLMGVEADTALSFADLNHHVYSDNCITASNISGLDYPIEIEAIP